MAPAAATRVEPSPQRLFVAGMLSLAVAMGIGRFAFTPLLPLMIRDGELDMAMGGWIAAANYVGYLLGALTASRLRWPATRLAAVALALTALLTAAMALPLGGWGWAAMRLVAGVCSAWGFVATAVWCLGALARAQRPSLASGVYAGVGSGITAPGLYCWAGASQGASAASLWLQLGALAAAGVAPVLFVLHSLRTAQPAAAAVAPAGAAPAGIAGLIACYALRFGYILPATFLPVLARSVVDDPRVFGLAWPVFGMTAALSTLVAGAVMPRVTRLRVWAVSNALMGAGVLLPSLRLSAWTIGLSALLVGGTFMIVTLAGVQEIRARVTGDPTPYVARMTSAFALGQIAGPVASSLLLHVPSFREHGLAMALQAGALFLFASALWLWRQCTPHPPLLEASHDR